MTGTESDNVRQPTLKCLGEAKTNHEKEKKEMRKRAIFWVVSVVMVLAMAGVTLAQEQKAPDAVVKEMVAKAKADIKVVSAADVKAAIENKEKAIFLDVRDAGEFSAGHLPEAVNVSRGTLEFKIADAIKDLDAKIYVYCKTTGRSTLATKTLNDLGYKNAVLMDTQFEDWIKAGYPVVR